MSFSHLMLQENTVKHFKGQLGNEAVGLKFKMIKKNGRPANLVFTVTEVKNFGFWTDKSMLIADDILIQIVG
ncbi:MAG: hypothetical protein ACOZAO_05365 [Patescibacteria group bacterium]